MNNSKIIKINGGLGNQMFQYALAFALKNKVNASVKFDTELLNSSRTEFKLSLERFGIIIEQATLIEKIKHRGLESSKYRNLNDFIHNSTSINIHKGYYKEKERATYDKTVFDLSIKYLDGYWQTEEYFSDFRCELLKEFDLEEKVSNKVPNYLRQICNTRHSVSIHVRRGDYLALSEYRNLTVDYYSEAVNLINDNYPECKFFVFSNDINWCKENFSFIKDVVFVDSTVDEYDDMFLMSKCQINITANSTFSWWAAWINSTPGKVVYCPKIWRNDHVGNYKGIPKGWNAL